MQQRIEKFASWSVTIGENIAYGNIDAETIIIQFFVDDGVSTRGHRTNLMKDTFAFMGSSSGPHGTYGHMTTIDYGGAMTGNGFQPLTTIGAPSAIYPPPCDTFVTSATCPSRCTFAQNLCGVTPAPVAPTAD
jgi:hypothetical protein